MPRHIHADCIIAWAEGKPIQGQRRDGSWIDLALSYPAWDGAAYRIKPEPKPDIVSYFSVITIDDSDHRVNGSSGCGTITKTNADNLKVTFDGETKKLKSVEMIGD